MLNVGVECFLTVQGFKARNTRSANALPHAPMCDRGPSCRPRPDSTAMGGSTRSCALPFSQRSEGWLVADSFQRFGPPDGRTPHCWRVHADQTGHGTLDCFHGFTRSGMPEGLDGGAADRRIRVLHQLDHRARGSVADGFQGKDQVAWRIPASGSASQDQQAGECSRADGRNRPGKFIVPASLAIPFRSSRARLGHRPVSPAPRGVNADRWQWVVECLDQSSVASGRFILAGLVTAFSVAFHPHCPARRPPVGRSPPPCGAI